MPRAATNPSLLRRAVATGVIAAVLLSTFAYAAGASLAVDRVHAARQFALLAVRTPDQAEGLAALDAATLQRAITARPFDQASVNVAMVRDVRQQGDARQVRWMVALSRLGWRDNAAQWNRLYAAANAMDVHTILDVGDALMRRRQMVEQLTPLLMLAEFDSNTRGIVIDRLASQPSWRETYLQSVATLTDPTQIEARDNLLRALQRRGSALTLYEAAANARAFDRGGRPDLGHALWASVQPGVATPLNDPRFARVSRQTSEETLVPYEWALFSGNGFGGEAFVEGGAAQLEIRWNGRGIPVFARQRTAARPGRYVLTIDTPSENVRDLAAIDFRLVCDGTVVSFRPGGANPARLASASPVPCAFPVFEIAGNLQGVPAPRQLILRGLRLDRVS